MKQTRNPKRINLLLVRDRFGIRVSDLFRISNLGFVFFFVLSLIHVIRQDIFAATSQPHLQFETKTIDLDTLFQGEKRELSFPFKNTGNADLIIDRTRSSCGCTAAFTTKKRVPPDSGGFVKVTFSSIQFRGQKTKHVRVFSNDPERPVDTLTLTVFVKSELDCTPRNVFLSKIKRGQTVSRTVRLYNPGTDSITVLNLLAYDDFVKVAWGSARVLAPGDTIPAVFHITPPDSVDHYKGSVGVLVNREPSVPFSIRVYGIFE